MIEIPARIRDDVVEHARSGMPNEMCGFLAGPDGRVERFYPIRNEDESPSSYLMDSTERFRAEDEIERQGWRVIAIYHSHTHTEAYPSETDRRRAFWQDLATGDQAPIYPDARYVIVSLADQPNPVVRAFILSSEEPVEEEVKVV
jgi:[CysO sulfur-carrier protein]-S-L-cysteine hydrolase